jgi:hypothetical protein
MTEDARQFDLTKPPAYALPLLQAFALASLTWGRLEAEVDHLLMLTFTEAEKVVGVKERIPNPWTAKCDAIAERFTKVPALVPMEAQARRIAETLREAADPRHTLVHGGFSGFTPSDPPRLEMTRYVFEGKQVTMKHYELTGDDLHRFRAGISERIVLVLNLSMWVAGRDAS